MAKKWVFKEIRSTTENDPGHQFHTTERSYLKIPLTNSYSNHEIGASASVGRRMDQRLVDKIYDLAKRNITRIPEVKRSLSQYIEATLFPAESNTGNPSKTNKGFYPTTKGIRNHVAKVISSFKYCADDQESLRLKITEGPDTSPDSTFFYRTRDDESTNDKAQKFVFVHQEPWQPRLLSRYGGELSLMDATYTKTKYAIPLFFVCVHTNVDYNVVAEFMCQSEEQRSIEAISTITLWNSTWKPKYFMVDYSLAEINALESSFPETLVCIFHRIQELTRWFRAAKNGLSTAEQKFFIKSMKTIG